MTEFLITGALFIAAGGVAGIVCLVIDVRAKRLQADWSGESGMGAQR